MCNVADGVMTVFLRRSDAVCPLGREFMQRYCKVYKKLYKKTLVQVNGNEARFSNLSTAFHYFSGPRPSSRLSDKLSLINAPIFQSLRKSRVQSHDHLI